MTMPLEFIYRDTVRYGDCDMHQHMNHARYLTFMEQARIGYLEALGMTVGPDLRTIPFVLVHASCDYRAMAHINDEVVTALGVTDIGRTSVTMAYRMTRGSDDTLLAEGKTVMAMYDYDRMESISVTDDFKQRVEQLRRSHL